MNIVTINDGKAVTMTSLELVGFINSQRAEGEAVLAHSDFLKKVPQVLGAEVAGNFSGYYKASNGKQNPMYTFPKREACLMAMSYSYDLQAKVFDRMTALEAKSAADPMAVLSDPAAMRGLLLTYTEKVIALESKVAEQAPKVKALDRIATADGSLCFTDAAKTLQIRMKDLIAWLSSHKWIYQRPGTSWIAYQDKIQSGYIEHKTNTVERSDGTEKVVTQARITPKGLAKLAEYFGPGNDSMAVIAA